jgi:hypothetical protein
MTGRVTYALFMLLALCVFLAARRLLPRPRELALLPWWQRVLLATAALVGGTFGSKLPFVLGGGDWLSGSAWLADGKTLVTGLAFAYLAVEATKLALGVRVKTGDSFALPLALALAVGRWGCFFNGCCFGKPTALPWGVDFGDGVVRHPTQVYECVFHLLMAGVLALLTWRGLLRGQRLKLYLIVYAVFRFATAFVRPEPPWWLGLTFYQWAALGLAAGLSVQWLIDSWHRAARPEKTVGTACPAAPPAGGERVV